MNTQNDSDLSFLNNILQNFNLSEIINYFFEYFEQKINKKPIFAGFYKYKNQKFNLIISRYNNELNIDKSVLEKSYFTKKIVKDAENLALPLVYLDKCLGIIYFLFEPDISNLNINDYYPILNIFSLIYYNVNLYNIAIKDSLTGLYNKRYFEYRINEENLNNVKFSIILLDIDFFKHYNDRYGHPIGDLILKKVANKIEQIIYNYKDSYVVRYGGEEFLIFLKEKSKIEAERIAEDVRRGIENLKIETKEYFWRVTISCGVSSYPDDGTINEIIKKADIALYYSKKSGRNKVTSYQNGMEMFKI